MIRPGADYRIIKGPKRHQLFRALESTFKYGPTSDKDTPKLGFTIQERKRKKSETLSTEGDTQDIRIPIYLISHKLVQPEKDIQSLLIVSSLKLETGECVTLELQYSPKTRSGSLKVRKK